MEKHLVELLIWNIINSAAIFIQFIFLIVLICKLSNRNMKYSCGQIKAKVDGYWTCLDSDYKNERCNNCSKGEISRIKESVKIINCVISDKHSFTRFAGYNGNDLFQFSCTNCGESKDFKKKDLTQDQKTIIRIQYPNMDIS